MDPDLPEQVNYWITNTSKHDCFFQIGSALGSNKRIGAIKILLIAQSEVFLKMLDQSLLAEVGDISVTDTDPDTFLNYLKCIYGGTSVVVRKLHYENCLKLLYLCEKYLTIKLKEQISSLLVQLYQPLSIDHVLTSLSYPACLVSSSNSLTKLISKTIQKETGSVLTHKLFLDLDFNALMFIVKQNKISVEESKLWANVLMWAEKKVDSEEGRKDEVTNLRLCLGDILKHIRFCAMKGDEFCQLVAPSKVLTPEEVYEICCSIGSTTVPKLDKLCCIIFNRFQDPSKEITITCVLNNVKEFTGEFASSKYELGGFKWHILLQRKKDELGIFLACSSAIETTSWKCCASFELILVNHSGKPDLTRPPQSHKFTNKVTDWGFHNFISFKDVVNIEKGFVKYNTIEVITNVELVEEK